MQHPTDDPQRPELDETPPLLGSWKRLYIFLIAALLLQILFYAWITWHFAP